MGYKSIENFNVLNLLCHVLFINTYDIIIILFIVSKKVPEKVSKTRGNSDGYLCI